MTYTTTTGYGTWCNRVSPDSSSPEQDLGTYIGGADRAWLERAEQSGALEEMQLAYRAAIDAALPPGISLCGNEFIGPRDPDDDQFDGYPYDEGGALDFKAMLQDIDLEPIVDAHDPITLEEIGLWELQSKAKNPAKAASAAMSRAAKEHLRLRPFAHLPHPESGRTQAIYLRGAVREALANRVGQGTRTDLKTDTA